MIYMYVLCTYMYLQSTHSIYKVWISPLINTKITIGVQQIVYKALCNCAMDWTDEMAQMVKAQDWYARRLKFRVQSP